jgi:hypothetical protein
LLRVVVKLFVCLRLIAPIPKKVFIRQDAETGDETLSRKPLSWDGFLPALKIASVTGEIPIDFLNKSDRKHFNACSAGLANNTKAHNAFMREIEKLKKMNCKIDSLNSIYAMRLAQKGE